MMGRLYSALTVVLISSTVVAANAADMKSGDAGWQRTVSRYDVTFDEKGRSTIVFDFEIRAIDDEGAAAISEQTFPYHSYASDLTSSDLAILKADGRLIALDEGDIRDQPASADSSSPSFGDERRRIIVYPNVAAGDTIRGRLIYQSKTADFAGEFADDGGAFDERRNRAEAGLALAGGVTGPE